VKIMVNENIFYEDQSIPNEIVVFCIQTVPQQYI